MPIKIDLMPRRPSDILPKLKASIEKICNADTDRDEQLKEIEYAKQCLDFLDRYYRKDG